MAAARLVSRTTVRVRVQVPRCSGSHCGDEWVAPRWLAAGNKSKTSGCGTEVAAQNQLVAPAPAPSPAPEHMVTYRGSPSLSPQVGDVLPALWANVVDAVPHLAQLVQSTIPTKAHIQMLLERGMMDCRFFTLLAVAGSLLGSILCFVEGSVMVFKSYFRSFLALSQRSDVGSVAHLLIEAIDLFIIGTAMLMFGMGLYTMFVASESTEKSRQQIPQSNLFGLFSLKTMPKWVEWQSLSQAKSRIGHAVMMILQVGILEKFKNIPLVTGLDLACFAGAVVVSSACIFVLAKLSA